jgi:hypothetical protein
MNRRHLLIALLLFLISTLALAYTPNLSTGKSGTTVYQYTAETAATANKQGTVLAGGLNWNCMGSRCSISGPWPTPAVASCKALAGMVGTLRSYGHNQGAQLDASQLAQCNAGLSVLPAKSMVTQPLAAQPLAPASSTLPVSKNPAPSLTVPASPPGVPIPYPNADKKSAVPANNQHSDRAVSSKDFTALALPVPPAAARATALPGPKSATSPATAPAPQNGFADTTAPKGGFTSVPTSPAISHPATRQLTNINPALTHQLKFRSDAYTNMKREQERVAAEAARIARERYANRNTGQDCDDSRADVSPRAVEICDHVDNNCNGVVDEGQTQRRYLDADGDLHGKLETAIDVCSTDVRQTASGAWLSDIGNDCDDTNPAIWHGCP